LSLVYFAEYLINSGLVSMNLLQIDELPYIHVVRTGLLSQFKYKTCRSISLVSIITETKV